MSGKGANPKEQIPCPKCGSRLQRRNMRKHERNMHRGVQRQRHVCPYCSAEKCRTYSTLLDWRNHLLDPHEHCLEDNDPLQREEYAAGFKLDRWERFHHLEGNENDQAYLRITTLRKHYGQYHGQEEGEPPGPPSTICLPHTKGTTPDRDVTEDVWGLFLQRRGGCDKSVNKEQGTGTGDEEPERGTRNRNGGRGLGTRHEKPYDLIQIA